MILFAFFSLMASASSLQAWNPPPITRQTLPNGFQLYLLEDHELPLFEAQLYIRVGGAYEPASLTGLSDVMAGLLETGGTTTMKPQDFDALLDSKSIHLSGQSGKELTNLSVSSLSSQWKEALQVLGDVALHPGWNEERFHLGVSRYKEGLRRDEDEPETIVARAFRKAVYGEDHPWARVPTLKSLDRIQIKNLKEFYSTWFQPDRMLLAVAGDFSSAEVKKWVTEWIGDKKSSPVVQPEWKLLPFENKPFDKKIKKKLTQTYIKAGHLGLERFNKDEFAYALLQYILGGEPFTSRLGADIRSDQGLAYTVFSDWDATPARGLFSIYVQTRVDATDTVLKKVRGHLERLSTQADVTPEELGFAQEALINKYIFGFDSPFKVVFFQAKYDLLGFPRDYLKKYPVNIQAVTLEQVRAVAKKYIQPDGLKTVVVGP